MLTLFQVVMFIWALTAVCVVATCLAILFPPRAVVGWGRKVGWRGAARYGLPALLLTGMFAGAILSLRASPAVPSLLARATRVADVRRDWDEGHGMVPWDRAGNGYHWIADGQVLVCRFTGETRVERVEREVWKFSRRDLRTGRETPLPALNALFLRQPAPHTWVEVSPDGRWLLWPGFGYCAAMLDGSRVVTWPVRSALVDAHWLGDSRHWVSLDYDEKTHVPVRALVFDVLDPHRCRVLRVPPVPAFQLRPSSPFAGPELGWDRDMRAFSLPQDDSARAHVIVARLGPRTAVRTFTVMPPPGQVFAGLNSDAPLASLLSPRGDLITWVCRSRWGLRSGYTLWVSRTDGSRMRLIGSLDPAKNDGTPYPEDLRWLPDERHLSFVYGDGLYTVPVP